MVRAHQPDGQCPAPLHQIVSAILRFANQNKNSVTRAAAAASYVGGLRAGARRHVISLERMNRVSGNNAADFDRRASRVITRMFRTPSSSLDYFIRPIPPDVAPTSIGEIRPKPVAREVLKIRCHARIRFGSKWFAEA